MVKGKLGANGLMTGGFTGALQGKLDVEVAKIRADANVKIEAETKGKIQAEASKIKTEIARKNPNKPAIEIDAEASAAIEA